MDEKIQKLKDAATNEEFADKIVRIINQLKIEDNQTAFFIVKTLFFEETTHHHVRYEIAKIVDNFYSQQFFNQVLSYFILKNFSDRISIIRALKSFAKAESVPSLIQFYKESATWPERLEVIDTLAAIPAPETIEFLSQIYNQQIHYQDNADETMIASIRERASSAMSKQLMRFND